MSYVHRLPMGLTWVSRFYGFTDVIEIFAQSGLKKGGGIENETAETGWEGVNSRSSIGMLLYAITPAYRQRSRAVSEG